MRSFTKLLFVGFALLLLSGYGYAQGGNQKQQITSVVGKLIRVTPKLADIDPNTMYGQPLKITRDKDGIIGISEEGEERWEKNERKNAKKFIDPLNHPQGTNSPVTPNTP